MCGCIFGRVQGKDKNSYPLHRKNKAEQQNVSVVNSILSVQSKRICEIISERDQMVKFLLLIWKFYCTQSIKNGVDVVDALF